MMVYFAPQTLVVFGKLAGQTTLQFVTLVAHLIKDSEAYHKQMGRISS